MDILSDLPPFHYLIAYFIPVILLGVFFGSLIDPHGICNAALFPQPAGRMHDFFWLFAIRELVLGMALVILEAYGEWRAATVLLACIGINGVTDFFSRAAAGKGILKSFQVHGVPTVAGYYAVWRLWQEHWA
jgi:hypothetical protein